MGKVKQLDIWNAIYLFTKIFGLKSLLFWENLQLNYNRNRWGLRLWYSVIFSSCFIFGFLLPTSLIVKEIVAEEEHVPKLILIIYGISVVASMGNWLQIFIKWESGESFVYGFNQIFNLQRSIFNKFLHHGFELSMEQRRRRQYHNLNQNYVYPSIAGTPVAVVAIVAAVLYFEMDPVPLYFKYYGSTTQTMSATVVQVLIFLYRLINISLLAYESARLALEVMLLIIFLFKMYEFCLAFLARLRSPFLYFNFSMKLQLCHAAMRDLVNSIYVMYLSMGQIGVVVFLWLTMKAMNHAPFLFYVSCPCFALTLGGMTFVMIDFLGATVFTRSSLLVHTWKHYNGQSKIFMKTYLWKMQKRQGEAQMPMHFSCGTFFSIRRETVLLYLNTVLGNLATAVLLVDF